MIDWLGRFGAMTNIWLGNFPTTQGRQAAAVIAMLGTTMVTLLTRFLNGEWKSPPTEWLTFLTIWVGIETLQFLGKRMTTRTELMPPERVSGAHHKPPNGTTP